MKFDDLDGNETEETFYFHLNRLEVAEMLELDELEKKVDRLTTAREQKGLSEVENTREAYEIFKDLILRSYGIKKDNVRFEKSDEIRADFQSHVAFENLIFEFIGNEHYAAEFFENCLPAKLVEAAKADLAAKGVTGPFLQTDVETTGLQNEMKPIDTTQATTPVDAPVAPEKEKAWDDYSREELLRMDQKLFEYLLGDAVGAPRERLVIAMQRKTQQ